MRPSVRVAIVASAVGLGLAACGGGDGGGSEGQDVASALASGDPSAGQEAFAANCAACHGAAAQGSPAGPPLVHEVYEPAHHSDVSFLLAVQNGVQPHHWDFGPMPAIPGLDVDDVADIVAYVRQLQRDAGIE